MKRLRLWFSLFAISICLINALGYDDKNIIFFFTNPTLMVLEEMPFSLSNYLPAEVWIYVLYVFDILFWFAFGLFVESLIKRLTRTVPSPKWLKIKQTAGAIALVFVLIFFLSVYQYSRPTISYSEAIKIAKGVTPGDEGEIGAVKLSDNFFYVLTGQRFWLLQNKNRLIRVNAYSGKIYGGNSFFDNIPPVYYTAESPIAAIDGDYLVVGEFNSLKVIDLRTKKPVKSIPIVQKQSPVTFDISGDTVVWSDVRNDKRVDKRNENEIGDVEKLNLDIFSFNIKTGEFRPITKDPATQMNPKIWQHYVVWQDNRNDKVKAYPGEWDIYMFDLNTGKEKQITFSPGSHTNPEISDNKIVWEDGRNFKWDAGLRAGDNVPENNTDIYLYDIKSGKEFPVATGPYRESHPFVNGNCVVWEDRNNGKLEADIMLYDHGTGKTVKITDDRFNQSMPKVYKDHIVWMDERRGISSNDVYVNGQPPNSDIFLYDLKTETERRLTGVEVQLEPLISDKWVVYTLSRQIAPKIQVIQYR